MIHAKELEEKLEKKIKYASIVTILLTIIFFIFIFAAAFLGTQEVTGWFFDIMYYGANGLLYIAPATYIVTLVMGIITIRKRILVKKDASFKNKLLVKFPTALFISSSVIFILFIALIIAVMSNANN